MNEEKDKNLNLQKNDNDLYGSNNLIFNNKKGFVLAHPDVFKKTEKIVAALYLVTSVMPEADPLRLMIRNQSLELLSLTRRATHFFHKYVADVISQAQEIISSLDIAFLSGYISEMNKNVIAKELVKFVEDARRKGHPIGGLVIEDNFFELPAAELTPQKPAHVQRPAPSAMPKTPSQGQNKTGSRKTERKTRIVENLKKHGPLTIKDIASHVKDCSEKTIQRELIGLIKDKIVQRRGERRWSVYSLV